MVVTEHILSESGEAERLGRKPQTFGSGSSGYLGCGWNSTSCHCMKLTGAHLPAQRRLPSSQLVPSPVRQDQQNPRQLHAPYILLTSEHVGKELMHVRESAPQDVQAGTLLHQHSSLAAGKWFSGRGWRFLGFPPLSFLTQNQ